MTLNLASPASYLREQAQLQRYLRQARDQLQTLETKDRTTSASTRAKTSPTSLAERVSAPNSTTEIVDWLDQLIDNTPTSMPLLTTQVLDTRKS